MGWQLVFSFSLVTAKTSKDGAQVCIVRRERKRLAASDNRFVQQLPSCTAILTLIVWDTVKILLV